MFLSKSKCWCSHNCLNFFKACCSIEKQNCYGVVTDVSAEVNHQFTEIFLKFTNFDYHHLFSTLLEMFEIY